MLSNNSQESQAPALALMARYISRPYGFVLVALAVAAGCGFVAYGLIAPVIRYQPSHNGLLFLILVNGGLGALLVAMVARRLMRLWQTRRSAGARLHIRLVGQFGAVAIIPAVLIAAFAVVIVNLGVEQWFSPRVKSALGNAVNVAQRYVQEHERSIVGDAYEIANSIEYDPELFDTQKHVRPDVLFTKLAVVTRERGLQASYILNSHGQVLGSTKQRFLPDMTPPTSNDIAQAARGTIVVDANSKVGRNTRIGVVRALIRMQALNDAYLLVVRTVDPKVLGYYQNTVNAVSEYKRLDRERTRIQALFAALYSVVALLTLLGAISLGLWAANRLAKPISRLIGAAERVSGGDLKVRVAVEREDDEVGVLGRTFNRMTSQLEGQRAALVEANRQIDARRQFTEAVLAGVSAGVLGLDASGKITIVNRAAARLLGTRPEDLEGLGYAEAVPEMLSLIRKAVQEPIGRAGGEVGVNRGGKLRTLSVQVSSEAGEAGYIVTFDDITDLVSAQRTAAWADVARRIAHEIKNPLTPIQLSAERLKRKYLKEVASDPDVFRQCTDTIIRQVGDIGRMVDEFSSFARMPQPQMKRELAQELLQHSVFLQQVAHPSITFTISTPEAPIYIECDGRLITQALTNVLKNATEAVAARVAKDDKSPGEVRVKVEVTEEHALFRIVDNGIGLPTDNRNRLTEPYVTTRVKGTGLGLAIVRKIIEDHAGELSLADGPVDGTGAEVRLLLPVRQRRSPQVRENGIADEQERIASLA